VQATCAGAAIAIGGLLRDAVSGLAMQGALGEALAGPVTGYGVVYLIEIALLFATIVAIGPLVRPVGDTLKPEDARLGLAGPHGAS
jgi:BCD family chlorophyll transporter-like MFS transporter